MSDNFKKDNKIFMKLTNSEKQIILMADNSELEKLVYEYLCLRYGKIFADNFKGFSVLLFEELDKLFEDELILRKKESENNQ